jgi:hypothetical protein
LPDLAADGTKRQRLGGVRIRHRRAGRAEKGLAGRSQRDVAAIPFEQITQASTEAGISASARPLLALAIITPPSIAIYRD